MSRYVILKVLGVPNPLRDRKHQQTTTMRGWPGQARPWRKER